MFTTLSILVSCGWRGWAGITRHEKPIRTRMAAACCESRCRCLDGVSRPQLLSLASYSCLSTFGGGPTKKARSTAIIERPHSYPWAHGPRASYAVLFSVFHSTLSPPHAFTTMFSKRYMSVDWSWINLDRKVL